MYQLSTTHQNGKATYFAWDGKKEVEVTEAEFNALPAMPTQIEKSVSADSKVDYSKMKNQELIDECSLRKLDISLAKVKADYVKLLEDDDAAKAEEKE